MSKGTRNEREAVEFLQEAGYATYRPATVRFGENDMFGLFDVLALGPSQPMRAIQVKSNRAVGIKAWRRHTALFRAHGMLTEYWVRIDNAGWRVIVCTDDGRETVVDEREHTETIGTQLLEYLESSQRMVVADD